MHILYVNDAIHAKKMSFEGRIRTKVDRKGVGNSQKDIFDTPKQTLQWNLNIEITFEREYVDKKCVLITYTNSAASFLVFFSFLDTYHAQPNPVRCAYGRRGLAQGCDVCFGNFINIYGSYKGE